MYSSDLIRAKHTAEIISKYLKINSIITDVLRERNLGDAVSKSAKWGSENSKMQEKTIDDKAFKGSESHRDT